LLILRVCVYQHVFVSMDVCGCVCMIMGVYHVCVCPALIVC
jgi:hypothetical protein